MKYLLPCECGQTTPVETSQAGNEVTCACGKAIRVPTLRGLRELAPAKDEGPLRKGPAGAPVDWSAARGMLFSLGLFTFVIALPYGAYHLWVWSQIDVAGIEAHEDEHAEEYFDQMTLEVLQAAWDETKNKTLEQTLPPSYVSWRDTSNYYQLRAQVGLIVAAVSGSLVALSLFVNRSPAATHEHL